MTDTTFVITSKIEKNLIIDFRKKLKKGKLLKCNKCAHHWVYTGNKKEGYTSCPNCHYGAINIERHQIKDK